MFLKCNLKKYFLNIWKHHKIRRLNSTSLTQLKNTDTLRSGLGILPTESKRGFPKLERNLWNFFREVAMSGSLWRASLVAIRTKTPRLFSAQGLGGRHHYRTDNCSRCSSKARNPQCPTFLIFLMSGSSSSWLLW